jgi:hypothetical protein
MAGSSAVVSRDSGLDEDLGDAETHDGRDRSIADHTNGSAMPVRRADHPRLPRRSRFASSRRTADHHRAPGVNRDASRSCGVRDSGGLVRHG